MTQIEPSWKKVRGEQIEPSPKKVRGRRKNTLALIAAMEKIAEETRPITGRGIGYKLFASGLISNMNEMNVVYHAMDPRQLRSVVETEINALIDRELWDRQEAHEAREKKSIEAL